MKKDSSAGTRGRYFLSAYLAPPGRNSILHSQRHDHAIALWRQDGRQVSVVAYWQLERLSGLKHHDLPLGSMESTTTLIENLLAEEGLSIGDIDEVWGTPGISTNRTIEDCFGSRQFPVHSFAHLYSAMLIDTEVFHNGNIIALAIDGGPDTALDEMHTDIFYVGACSKRGEISYHPIESPGPLFIAAQERFGWAPGTLMALAEASEIQTCLEASSFLADRTFFGGYGVYSTAREVLEAIVPIAEAAATRLLAGTDACPFSRDELVASASMKVVQEITGLLIQRNIEMLLESSGLDSSTCHLALAGGVALNCPTNSRMMQQFDFIDLLAPPCVDDTGQALGLGLLGLSSESSPRSFDFRLGHAFHGSARIDLDAALEEYADFVVSTAHLELDQFVADISRSPVGWVDGRAEIGPRALGHRSILADPRNQESKTQLNIMKGRQWWRPVAPIVLADQAAEWFEDSRPSPFMLQTLKLLDERRPLVPAVVHLDGSARVQTLSSDDDARLFQVLRQFYRHTGVPIFCNTSLNDRGEPIASTACDALNFCVRKGLTVIYVQGIRVEIDPTARTPPPGPRIRNHEVLQAGRLHYRAVWREWLDDGATAEVVYLLNRFPEFRPLGETHSGRRDLRRAFDLVTSNLGLSSNYFEYLDEFGPYSAGSSRHSF